MSEFVIFLLATSVASAPLWAGSSRNFYLSLSLCSSCILAGSLWVFWQESDDKPQHLFVGQQTRRFLPHKIAADQFVGSATCKSCHPRQHATWHQTYHRTMTQVANPQSVAGSFDDVRLHSRDGDYHLYRKKDEFWVTMPNIELLRARRESARAKGQPAGEGPAPMVERRVVMTTGSHKLQAYWVPSSRGRELLQLPWMYSIPQQRWIPAGDTFIQPPDHKQSVVVWNAGCIQCHSLNGKPDQKMESSVTDFGISCESCHGPGERHIAAHQGLLGRYRRRLFGKDDPTIVNPSKVDPKTSTQICAQCHSNFMLKNQDWWNGGTYRAGGEFDAAFHQFFSGDEIAEKGDRETAQAAFWSDGTMRIGGREYLPMAISACFTNGTGKRRLSCLSCHQMHDSDPNDQLKKVSNHNESCLQCHEQYRDRIQEHTHHSPSSSGSQCYNCHMPHTSYALFNAVRSHRIDIPAANGQPAKPNACNQCHLDRTLAWTADRLQDWYGIKPPELSAEEKTTAASLLWLLKGDAAHRAVTAWSYGWKPALEVSGKDWQAPALARLLEDPYPPVRYVAYQSLRKLPGYADFSFDFVVAASVRKLDRERAVLRWPTATGDLANRHRALLLRSNGTSDDSALRTLLRQRDDRRITLPE